MKIVHSDRLPHGGAAGSHYDESLWIYNGLDNCITFEVHEALSSIPGGFAYDMSRMMQAPALALMRRGIRVDFAARDEVLEELGRDVAKVQRHFNQLTSEGIGLLVNHRSPAQLKSFFYETLRHPEIKRYDKKKRERVATTNREALEKLEKHPTTGIFAKFILTLRDLEKQIGVLRTGTDADGRMRSSYNVVGTETGRWSSSANVFGTGTNGQNLTDSIRRMFIPDPGMKMAQHDLAQAESVIVGAVSGDEEYQKACASGDPHTYVCELCWPDLAWREAKSKSARRAIAEIPFYRHWSYRDMAKRGGHGSNYGGTPAALSIVLKIEQKIAEDFQRRYFSKFPGIRMWQLRTQQKLAVDRQITTAFGRNRFFTGRPTDSSTIKEAIAYEPQSVIGDYLNQGLFRVWYELDFLTNRIQVLAQVHDAILFQFDPSREDEAALHAEVSALISAPITIRGREFVIRTDATSGWNWGKVKYNKDGSVKENAHGLREFRDSDDRTPPPARNPLDRRVSTINGAFK